MYLAPAPWIGFLTKWASSVLSLLLQKQLHRYQSLRLCLNEWCGPEQKAALQRIFWPYPFTILGFTLQSDPRVREWVFFQMKQWSRMVLQVCIRHYDLLMGLLCTGPRCSWSGENSTYKTHTAWALAPQNRLCGFPDLLLLCCWCRQILYVLSEELIFHCCCKPLLVILTFENHLCHIRSVWDCKPSPSSSVGLILCLQTVILYPSAFKDFHGDSLYITWSEVHTETYLLFGEMSCLWPYSAYCKCLLWEVYRYWPKYKLVAFLIQELQYSIGFVFLWRW